MLLKGDRGWFNARLNYLRSVQNAMNKSASNKSQNRSQLNTTVLNDDCNDEAAAADILYLKSLPINDSNLEIFTQKLNSTREYRQKMLLDKSINLKEQFPYFFVKPELVRLFIDFY